MKVNEQYIARALEANVFQSTDASAALINPTIWVRQVEDFAKSATIMRPLGRERMDLLGQAGDSLKVQFEKEIFASELTESVALTLENIVYEQVTYVPTEYGTAVGITDKQRVRSIQDVLTEKAEAMGYALAKKLDQEIFAALEDSDTRASTVTELTANGVALSALASSDKFSTDLIADGLFAIDSQDEQAQVLVLHSSQIRDLRKSPDFVDASIYGGREVVLTGEIGRYLGIRVLMTNLVPRNADTSTARNAYMLGANAFGICWKRGTSIRNKYDNLKRRETVAAVHEYDVKVEHPGRIVRLVSHE